MATRRIAPDVRIHTGLFLAIRLAVVALALAWLSPNARFLAVYTALLFVCLAVYLLHSVIASSWRAITFLLLKLCRNCIPLMVLAPYVPGATLAWLCAIFFLMDAPWRMVVYCRWRGLVREAVSVSKARCANVAALLVVGAGAWFIAGSPYLLAVASYYAVLEGFWAMRAALPRSITIDRSLIDVGQTGKAGSPSASRSQAGAGDSQAVRPGEL